MIRRLLPPTEWPKLAGTELDLVWPHLDPEKAKVIVVEDDDVIVACWALFPVLHAEGIYVHPAYRQNATVARLLLRGLHETAHAMGAKTVATSALSDEIADYAQRIGGMRMPGEHFLMTVEDPCQRQSRFH